MELLRLTDVCKSFPGVKALDHVSLSLQRGEILGLVGENGAGKSTLMKILSGVYPSSEFTGSISVSTKQISFSGPRDAEHAGIAIIHQELVTFPHLTVAENFFVGHWPGRSGLINDSDMHAQTQYWLEQIRAPCHSTDILGTLTQGTQQLVEIAKALSRQSEILILDEPTSSLTPRESQDLFILLKKLRSEGKGLIYISHKLEEIFDLCDRVTILRDGQTVASEFTEHFTTDSLIQHMVGRPLGRAFPEPPSRDFSEIALSVENLMVQSPNLRYPIGPLNFELKRGEILGFAGLLGSGRTEFMHALLGASPATGTIRIRGEEKQISSPRESLRLGIGSVSEDRKRESLFAHRSLLENYSISRLAMSSLAHWIDLAGETYSCEQALTRMRTRTPSLHQEIQNLSGGNQQKVFIARALHVHPKILILDEPTRGIDVGAKYEIYEIIFTLAQSGKAILLVSSDLPELMAMSDRIAVMAHGQLRGILPRAQVNQDAVMKLAIGSDLS